MFKSLSKLERTAISGLVFLTTLCCTPVFAKDAIPLDVLVEVGNLYESQNDRLTLSLKDAVSGETREVEVSPVLAWKYLTFASFTELLWSDSRYKPELFNLKIFRSWFLTDSDKLSPELFTLVQKGFPALAHIKPFRSMIALNENQTLIDLVQQFGTSVFRETTMRERSRASKTSHIMDYRLKDEFKENITFVRDFYRDQLKSTALKERPESLIRNNGIAFLEVLIVQLNEAGLSFPVEQVAQAVPPILAIEAAPLAPVIQPDQPLIQDERPAVGHKRPAELMEHPRSSEAKEEEAGASALKKAATEEWIDDLLGPIEAADPFPYAPMDTGVHFYPAFNDDYADLFN